MTCANLVSQCAERNPADKSETRSLLWKSNLLFAGKLWKIMQSLVKHWTFVWKFSPKGRRKDDYHYLYECCAFLFLFFAYGKIQACNISKPSTYCNRGRRSCINIPLDCSFQVDASNSGLMEQHVTCAAAEMPLYEPEDGRYFGPALGAAMSSLAASGIFLPSISGKHLLKSRAQGLCRRNYDS